MQTSYAREMGWPVAMVFAVCAGTVGCNSPATPTQASAATAAVAAPVAPVAPTSPQPDTPHFTTTGPLVADQQSDVAAERDGRVVHIAVEIGDHVRRGQVLASLDDRTLRAAIDSQTAHLASLRAQVREWESEEKMDGADLRRADQMRSEKILSEEGWEHVKYKLDEVTAEVARYRADTTAAEADLAAAKLQLDQCHIVAPLTGVVGRRSARLEQEVKKGDVLFWITAESPLRILFTVPESAMATFRVGAPLELTTPDYPILHQAAHVFRVSPVVDPASDSIQVIGTLDHPAPSLKPGMSMQVAAAQGAGRAMNLSEALDAALPEIPKAKLARTRPPCLDPELIVREDAVDGEPVVALFQRREGNFFRFSPIQWQLAKLFDGERSYDEIATLFEEQTGALLPIEDARMFAKNMDEQNFWYQTPQERNIALNEKLTAQRNRRANRTSKFNVAHISFNGWDPDRYLTLLDNSLGAIIYSKWSVLAAALLFAFEAVIFVTKWHVIGPDIPLYYNFSHKSFMELVQFWLLFLVIGFFHETAHGLTCKHYGGEVHKMGLMLIYLTPAFFVDVTETWVSATKVQRLATIIAGIWIEMIFCGIGMIVWTNTQAGQWLHDFSYEVILITGLAVIVVNLNPLIKLDGYYFLTEFIGVPDLKERSTSFLSGWFQTRILRLTADVPAVSRSRVPFFALYAFVSAAYSYMLLFFVVRFAYNITFNWMAEFALIPATALALTVFKSRLRSLRDVLKRIWQKHFVTGQRLHPAPFLLLAAAIVLFFVPILRDHEDAYFVIEPARSYTLRAATPGQVESVLVQEGETVHAGQPLLQLRSTAVDTMRSAAAAQADAARFETYDAEVHDRSIGAASVRQAAAESSIRLAGSAQAMLRISAPVDGVVLTEDPQALIHREIGPGESLLTLGASGDLVARVYVPAISLERIQRNAEVSLLPPGRFTPVHLTLPALEGDAVKLPDGLVAMQDYKGITLPTFYYARIPLPASANGLPFGLSGEARIFGPRRSVFQRTAIVVANLIHEHLW